MCSFFIEIYFWESNNLPPRRYVKQTTQKMGAVPVYMSSLYSRLADAVRESAEREGYDPLAAALALVVEKDGLGGAGTTRVLPSLSGIAPAALATLEISISARAEFVLFPPKQVRKESVMKDEQLVRQMRPEIDSSQCNTTQTPLTTPLQAWPASLTLTPIQPP